MNELQRGHQVASRVVACIVCMMGGAACAGVGRSPVSTGPSTGSPYEPPVTLRSFGITFEVPTTQALVTAEQAIAAAQSRFGDATAKATTVDTAYGSFTDVDYGATDGEDGPVTPKYVDVPAWIVTFGGTSVAMVGKAGVRREAFPKYGAQRRYQRADRRLHDRIYLQIVFWGGEPSVQASGASSKLNARPDPRPGHT